MVNSTLTLQYPSAFLTLQNPSVFIDHLHFLHQGSEYTYLILAKINKIIKYVHIGNKFITFYMSRVNFLTFKSFLESWIDIVTNFLPPLRSCYLKGDRLYPSEQSKGTSCCPHGTIACVDARDWRFWVLLISLIIYSSKY